MIDWHLAAQIKLNMIGSGKLFGVFLSFVGDVFLKLSPGFQYLLTVYSCEFKDV